MAETLKQIVNFDNLTVKRQFMEGVRSMTGLWEVSLKPRRFTRSLSQNAYLHAAFVPPFCEWLREEWGDPSITTDQAFIELKKAVLGPRTKVNERTGETMELTPTTHDMDTATFGVFLDSAAEFLARACGIVVLSPEIYFEIPAAEKRRKAS